MKNFLDFVTRNSGQVITFVVCMATGIGIGLDDYLHAVGTLYALADGGMIGLCMFGWLWVSFLLGKAANKPANKDDMPTSLGGFACFAILGFAGLIGRWQVINTHPSESLPTMHDAK